MNQGQKDIFRVRVISVGFITLALAVFKPFGLDAWHWQAYMHLLNIFILGVAVCMLTDVVMKYIVKMPCNMEDIHNIPSLSEMMENDADMEVRSYSEDINYFIRRNLYFQIVNTVLESLMICLYRHFMLSGRVEGNQLSWNNFFETLLIIAFCSFAIGLYWRFKFRSKYLAAELEDTKMLNMRLKRKSEASDTLHTPTEQHLNEIVLSGTTNESVTLQITNLLYIEAVGNYVKVYHLRDGKVQNDMLRATSKQMEDDLRQYPMIVRCHRAFLVNLGQVEQIVSHSGTMQLIIKHSHESIPVSRSKMSQIKDVIKNMY